MTTTGACTRRKSPTPIIQINRPTTPAIAALVPVGRSHLTKRRHTADELDANGRRSDAIVLVGDDRFGSTGRAQISSTIGPSEDSPGSYSRGASAFARRSIEPLRRPRPSST
jgi:hypothetical protein